MKGKAAFGCILFVAWSLALVQAERKVVAVVLKNPNFQGAPVLKLNAHKVLSAPSDQATIQQTTPIVANAVKPVATPNYVENDAAPVPVINEKPKKVIRYKLIRMSDEDIKKEAEAKQLQQLKDAEDEKLKKVLYPCRDYSPICARYKNMWNPAVAQCRDVWMQRNCRETCGLCKIPVGVYLACHDMWHCKKLATHSCVHDWVRKTCKSMCGSCDGSKGGNFARVGASSVFVGKKKSLVETKKEKEEKEEHDEEVKTVHQAVKLQAKPIKAEDPNPKEGKDDDDSTADEKDDIENDQSGDNSDDKENDDNDDDDDDDDDDKEMEKQPADSNMENESGDDEETKDDKPKPVSEVNTKPAKHASVPKVTKKTEQKPVVQKPVAPKVHHHKHKKTAKNVVQDKKPKATKVQVLKKIHDEKPKVKKVKAVKVLDKKVKNPVKTLVMKHKKTTHVVHHKKPAKKVKTVKKAAKKN